MGFTNSTNNININSPVTSTAISYTALLTDSIIEVTSTAAPRTITLPAPSSSGATNNVGKMWVIKDTSGGAQTNNITLSPASGTIDGASSLAIAANYGFATVISDGTNYSSVSRFIAPVVSGLTYTAITANQTLAVNNGYFVTSGALSLALPATSALGSVIEVFLSGGTSWTITQAAGQQIRFGNQQTTSGAGGSLASSAQGDAIRFVCDVANNHWQIISSIGNLTVT